MNKQYIKQNLPYLVSTNSIKTIEEYFGIPSTGNKNISIAHMIAPPSWSEPFQTPKFDEYIIIIKGQMMAKIDNDEISIKSGETLFVSKNTRVKYFNPFNKEAEYWSICIPAFSVETANRE